MMDDLEAAINTMSRRGWRIILYPEKLPVFKNSFVMVARRPGLVDQKINLTLADSEKQFILVALALTGNNIAKAARNLGISRSSLERRVKKLGIEHNKRNITGDRSVATLTTNFEEV